MTHPLDSLIDQITEPEARLAQMRQISELQTKLALEMEAFRKYG